MNLSLTLVKYNGVGSQCHHVQFCVDNSEWTRNGDYSPSRLEAAKEAANYLASRKLADNVENCVGIMTMGGINGKCLLSLTSEAGKISTAVGLIQHEEGCNFESSIKIAQIVLKHRQNTNQKQRIIAFLGSPLSSATSKESLQELGLKMKKNGVAIDIIDYGTENRSNTEILVGLIESVDTEAHPSRLITIESGNSHGIFLLDALKSKVPELFNRSGASSGVTDGFGAGDGFDFDPELDPELAMALKLSMEEEVNRQKSVKVVESDEIQDDTANDDKMTSAAVEDENGEDFEDENDEELMLARAIALSMEQQAKEEHK